MSDGILAGLEVLDLSWGIAGPMAGMLLADHGARVTRIEPPTGDPFESSGSRVWLRGKRLRWPLVIGSVLFPLMALASLETVQRGHMSAASWSFLLMGQPTIVPIGWRTGSTHK